MQYPVPQFTDVEDKIIGSLTIKQFGIVFGAGIVCFLMYSATKSIGVLLVFIVLLGLPAIILAFAKPFGRPLYTTIPYIVRFMFGPKVLVFHKDANYITDHSKFKNVIIEGDSDKVVEKKPVENAHTRLKEINKILEQQAAQEAELIKQVK